MPINDVWKTIENAFTSPIKNFLKVSVAEEQDGLLYDVSLTFNQRFVSESRTHRDDWKEPLIKMLKMSERDVLDRHKASAVKVFEGQDECGDKLPPYLYGMPYRIIDTPMVEDALILISPKKHLELLEKEASSREGWIFTK